MSSTTQIPCCLSFRTKPDNKNVGSGQMLIGSTLDMETP
ncbi:Uncharacterised protein [Escherichia coli]|uniref:Uncharacterized protein n=1 Tax=Escherichia coli TaxID=562 RepID=A0A376YL89_ECOLX|nr:Uncharacterised protein [Escherichia coli]